MVENDKQSKFAENLQKAPYLQDEVVNFIFNNLRNVGLSILPLLAAKAYLTDSHGDSVYVVWLVVLISIVTAIMLLALNILHGWRKIFALHISRWVIFTVAILYAYAISIGFALLMQEKIPNLTVKRDCANTPSHSSLP